MRETIKWSDLDLEAEKMTIRILTSTSRLAAIQKAAAEFGFTVYVLASEGQVYANVSKDSANKVPENSAYISIKTTGLTASPFWNRVDEIERVMKIK